jgi:hypothetical protein
MWTYGENLCIGITSVTGSLPERDRLVDALGRSLDELVAATGRPG